MHHALRGGAAVCVAVLWLPMSVAALQSPTFVLAWGREGTGQGEFTHPGAIAIGPTGLVYVGDTNNDRIQVFQQDGTFVTEWGSHGSAPGQFYRPSGLAVDADGFLYVADRYNYRIQKFLADGTFVTSWGTQGTGPGEFDTVYDVAIGADGAVFVVDSVNHRIQKFDGDGTFLLEWGSYCSGPPNGGGCVNGGDGQFAQPEGIAVDASGAVYVADTFNHRIQKFDADGSFLLKWGSLGSGNEQFYDPLGLGTDGDGNVYVAETSVPRIKKFDAAGTFLLSWGTQGSEAGEFDHPIDVALTPTDEVFVVDWGNDQIHRFGDAPVNTGRSDIAVLSWSSLTKNPTREPVMMYLQLPQTGNVVVRILDVRGRVVREATAGPLVAGVHPIGWDLVDQRGALVPAGVYFATAQTSGSRAVQRIVVLKK